MATDPRDKLYGILGLTNERKDAGLRPDYTLSVEEVYTRLARNLIVESQSLDFLGSAGLLRDYDVPPWVPDWTITYLHTGLPFYQFDQRWKADGTIDWRKDIYAASRKTTPDLTFERTGCRLVARRFLFDQIADASVARPWPGDLHIWEKWTKFAHPDHSPYFSDCSRFQAFEKVLTADTGRTWADWSAERGGRVESFTDPAVNLFGRRQEPAIDTTTWNRRLFVTAKGYMGIAPATAEPGDAVCILFGSQTPMVLREEGDHWLFVGQAYIQGIMDGEALEGVNIEHGSRLFDID